jgi:hypothetical protein
MSGKRENVEPPFRMPEPHPALRQLDRLVGTWNITGYDDAGGELKGTEVYEWMEGGFFMKQEVDQLYSGQKIRALQIIGYERKSGTDESADECTAYFFDNMGNAWEYVWEMQGDLLTIWGGYVGSPAAYRGRFISNGNVLQGRWDWPGGGYKSTSVRVK